MHLSILAHETRIRVLACELFGIATTADMGLRTNQDGGNQKFIKSVNKSASNRFPVFLRLTSSENGSLAPIHC
jgi:hypothetical protein